jgi:FG-GAP-like repeat
MTKSLRIAQMALVVLLTIPGLAWALPPPLPQALIVHDGTPGLEADVVANLTGHLTGKGFTVTTNVGLPGSLVGNQQVWDVRYNNSTPLTASDITAYKAYLAGGGSLFVMGENTGFVTRDNSIIALVSSAGGGTMILTEAANAATVLAPFTGPTPLASFMFEAAAGVKAPSKASAITLDSSNVAAAVVFGPGMLSSASAGSLILVFDVNFLQTANPDPNSQIFTDNLISYLAAPVVVQPNILPGPPHDLDGDGRMDLVWRQTQTGDVAAWLMNGSAVKQASLVSYGPFGVPLAWQIGGIGDVNGDGKADLIWLDAQTGEVAVSLMNGTTVSQTLLVPLGVQPSLQIAGVGDLDGDSKSDLVWRNNVSGDVAVWLMNGASVTKSATIASGVPLAWQIAGVGDVNGDGQADLVWRNTQTGDVAVWLMNGATVAQTAVVGPGVALAWQIAGVGDLDGDGKADLVWRNTQTGDVAVWLMNGTVAKQTAIVASGVALAWQIVEVGDLNHDGNADLVWRETQTGDVAAWLMNGAGVTQEAVVASGVPLAWQTQ